MENINTISEFKTIISKLIKNKDQKYTIVFIEAYDLTLNRPSRTPVGAWAAVETTNEVLIIKESKSTNSRYAKQDIGFGLHSQKFGQHYNVTNNQFNEIFGIGMWDKKWMEFNEFMEWKNDRKLITLKLADTLQEESWKSTGHR